MMKILMMAPLPPPSGGIASWTIRYRDYCTNNQISLEIVNIAMVGNRATKESMKRNLFDELKRTCCIFFDLRKKITNYHPSIIHINTSCSKFGVIRDAFSLLISKFYLPNSSIVVHCRCNIEDQLKGSIAKIAFRFLVKNCTKVIVLNRFSKKFVDDIIQNKAEFVPNFIDEKMIDVQHFIRKDIKKVVFVGHIEKGKGLVEINEAAHHYPDIQFYLVGAVREDISDINLSSNIIITGRVGFEIVHGYLKDSDLFLFPSKTEGFSNALLEAMAMGLPVIASDVGANSEMLEDKGGIILSVNTGNEICRAIDIMRDWRIRKSMSQWNVKKVKQSYMINKVMKQYMNLYNTLK